MKIAVLGGSFNPIHIGHLILGDYVCTELGYDKVLYVPCFIPPHKEMAEPASAADRLEMTRLAVDGDERFEAESYEVERGGTSYTWDTVCYIENKYAGHLSGKIGLVIGFDLASHFEDWKNAGLLAEKCSIILASRTDVFIGKTSIPDKNSVFNEALGKYRTEKSGFKETDFKFPYIRAHNPEILVSSSQIRGMIKSGGPWRYLVNCGVFDYIKKKGLYGYIGSEYQ